MPIKENCNLEELLSKIKECKGKVTFETPEGDLLAMKSALCQYIFLSLKNQPELLFGGIIKCELPADYKLLSAFFCSS